MYNNTMQDTHRAWVVQDPELANAYLVGAQQPFVLHSLGARRGEPVLLYGDFLSQEPYMFTGLPESISTAQWNGRVIPEMPQELYELRMNMVREFMNRAKGDKADAQRLLVHWLRYR